MDSTTAFLAACAHLDQSSSPSPSLQSVTRPFLSSMIETGQVPADALAALDRLRPHGAAWIAIVIGSAVERGVPAASAGESIVGLFRQWVEALTSGNATKEHEEALPSIGQATVAHLSRMPERRAALAADSGWMRLLEECEERSHAITWVRALLLRRAGQLFVVHADSRRVVKMQFAGVSNCFHLFSLIQTETGSRLPGGEAPDPKIAAAARGDDSVTGSDRAWWHYQLRGSKVAVGESAWGEAHIDTLMQKDGTYAVALWSTILSSRTWNTGFFSPTLEADPSTIEWVTELEGAEAQAWCDQLL